MYSALRRLVYKELKLRACQQCSCLTILRRCSGFQNASISSPILVNMESLNLLSVSSSSSSLKIRPWDEISEQDQFLSNQYVGIFNPIRSSDQRREHETLYLDFSQDQGIIELAIPNNIGLEVSLDKILSTLSIGALELLFLDATTNGDCEINSLKARNISVSSTEGKITVHGSLTSDTELSGKGITVKKLQGDHLTLVSSENDIHCSALYGKHVELSCAEGKVYLGSCHGSVKCELGKGDFKCDALDGDLHIRIGTGDFNAFVARHSRVIVETRDSGNISLTLDSEFHESVKAVIVTSGEVGAHTLDPNCKPLRLSSNREMSSRDFKQHDGSLPSDIDKQALKSATLLLSTPDGQVTVDFCSSFDWFVSSLNKK